MIESFIIALREGIEVALVIGILLAYIRRLARPELISTVYLGLGAGLVASIVGAILLQRFALDHEMLEGYFMILAAVFVGTMVVWMWVTAKSIRGEIEERIDRIVGSTTDWRMYTGMFAFTLFMVIREGIETAIFLQAVALSTQAWSSVLGTLGGFTVAIGFAILFIKGSVRIDIVRFLKVTAITLLIFVVQLLVNGLHEFYEYGILSASPRMMGILGPIVRNDVFFIIAIVSLPALMVMIPSRKIIIPPRQRRFQLGVAITAVVIVVLLGVGKVFSSIRHMDLSAVAFEVPGDGVVRIPIESVDDGNVHRYSINDRGVDIRFFVLRTGLGKFASAFDACYACYDYGRYYLRDGQLICSQCEAPVSLMKLRPAAEEEQRDENMSGSMEGNGCAPIFLASRIKSGQIEIKLADLQSRRKYFETSAE